MMSRSFQFLLTAVMAWCTLTSFSAADVFYWDGDVAGGDGFNWNFPANWSTTRPANTDPAGVPGAGDTVVFARDAGVDNSFFLDGNHQIGQWVTDTSAVAFPFVDGNFLDTLTITGLTSDLPGGFTNVPNVVMISNGQSTTFSANVRTLIPGGQNNAFFSGGGIELKFEGLLQESSPGAGLVKYGFNDLVLEGPWGLTGDIIINQGHLRSQLFPVNTMATMTISDGTLGNFRGFKMGNQAHTVGNLVIQNALVPAGLYTAAQLNALVGTNNSFQGSGTLRVLAVPLVPEPSTVVLMISSAGIFFCGHRRSPA